MKSLVTNRSLRYLPKGSSFITSGGAAQYVNCTAPGWTHGPGTGGSCAGTASIEPSVPSDLLEGRNFLRVNWTGAPTNYEGRSPYTTYFSNCYAFQPGASDLAGEEVLLLARLRNAFSSSVTIPSFFSDGLGASGAERFIFGNKITIPPGNVWIDYAHVFRPAPASIVPATTAGDIFSCGFGIETAQFSGLSLPGHIDYSIDVVEYDRDEIDEPSMEEDFSRGSMHVRLMGRGATGYAISSSQIRLALSFGGRPMLASPGFAVQGVAYLWQGASQFYAASPSIVAANEVTQYGAILDIGGFSGLTTGVQVITEFDFLLADAG